MYKLLLADDSVTVQRVIQLTFAGEDVAVEAVSDGDEAIARLEAAPPDIVLADVGMPGKNGYEVARYLKRSPRLSRIPVVLLTGAFEQVDRARADAAGCDGVLAKPFVPKTVIDTVRELLNRGPQRMQGTVDAGVPGAQHAVAGAPLPPVPAPDPLAPASSQAPTETPDQFLDQLQAAIADLSGRPPASQPPKSDPPPSYDAPGTALPTLADAFAAFLAAEQREAAVGMTWPTAPAAPPGDALVDEVVARVLAKLSGDVVRETVTDLVSAIAEQLVREEIDRIKAAIK